VRFPGSDLGSGGALWRRCFRCGKCSLDISSAFRNYRVRRTVLLSRLFRKGPVVSFYVVDSQPAVRRTRAMAGLSPSDSACHGICIGRPEAAKTAPRELGSAFAWMRACRRALLTRLLGTSRRSGPWRGERFRLAGRKRAGNGCAFPESPRCCCSSGRGPDPRRSPVLGG
jgi:hypothetical protein